MSTESNEFEGKNLDVAVWKASQELEIDIEKLRYKIIEKGQRGQGTDPGTPARIRILSAEEAEAAVTAAPAREEPPRQESRPERPEAQRESRSRRQEERDDDEGDETAEETAADDDVAHDDVADDDREEAADEMAAGAGDEAAEATDDDEDAEVDDDLDEPPSSSSALLEDDDPIEIAREARRRSAQAQDGRAEQAKEPADDEPVVEAREPRREPRRESRPRRRPARQRDERAEETGDGDEPAVEARESRREPRRERPSRQRGSHRPEGALDPDDLESGLEKAREIIPQLLSQMGFDLKMEAEIQEDHIYVPLLGEDCMFLLEHRAEGLNALQFLVNKMAYRGGPTRILVDADGYRKERQEELVERARAVADEVRDGGNSRSLGSLNPFERRLVHMALRDDEDVRTVSKGEGFLKRMEIAPKHGGDEDESRGSERRGRRRERY